VETAPVKHRIAAAVGRYVRGPALGINPMFAPDLAPAGRSVAAVTYREGPGVAAMVGLLAAAGVQVIAMDAEEHDRAMAAVQVAVHATVLAFGRALSRLGMDAGRLDAVATPPYATLLAVLARILGGESAVYRDIQRANPYGRAARTKLADALRAVARAVDRDDDAAFAGELNGIAAFLGTGAARARDHCARLFTITPPGGPEGPHGAPTGM
jgi:prephenate dehydrogenase